MRLCHTLILTTCCYTNCFPSFINGVRTPQRSLEIFRLGSTPFTLAQRRSHSLFRFAIDRSSAWYYGSETFDAYCNDPHVRLVFN